MATLGLLPEHMVSRVFDALQGSTIELDSLLWVLPEPVRAGLPQANAPQQRWVVVLMCLNNYRTPDEQPPLIRFLQWAVKMCRPRLEANVLLEAITMLEEGTTSEHVPEPGRTRRPWYLGVVKRLYRQRGFADFDPMDAASPIFVGWDDLRARVVGIAVGDLHRTIHAVKDHLRIVQRGATSVEGHVVFPEEAPSEADQERVLTASLLPVWLDDLRRSTERALHRKVSPSIDTVIARQSAWAVERCKAIGALRRPLRAWSQKTVLDHFRDGTSARLTELVNEVRDKRLRHVLIRVARPSLLAIAGSSLLTAWNDVFRVHRGRWPLYLTVDDPFPFDVDDLLNRVLSEQRVTSDRDAADSLLSDEESVPVLSCVGDVSLLEARRTIQTILVRKKGGIVLVPDDSAPLSTPTLLGWGSASTRVCRFPSDFKTGGTAGARPRLGARAIDQMKLD